MSSQTSLWWPGRLLTEDDLRRHWMSQGEVVIGTRTIVTPLAWDLLRSKRVAVRREDKASDTPLSTTWGYAVETPSPLAAAAIRGIERPLAAMESAKGDTIAWLKSIAAQVAKGTPVGAVVVNQEPGLAAYVANTVRGIRAAAVSQPGEVKALQKALGPNVFAVPLTRTYFELRQIVKLVTESAPACPKALEEVHRANR